jgi:ribose 5-phosphate isomerase A
MVDETKLVARLANVVPVPVEVVPFGWKVHEVRLCELGADPVLRVDAAGTPFRTDEGHHIIDCAFAGGITDLRATDNAIRSRPGVVETGLFLDMSPEVFVGRSA